MCVCTLPMFYTHRNLIKKIVDRKQLEAAIATAAFFLFFVDFKTKR